MRDEAIKPPIKHARRDERINIPNIKQMLTTGRNPRLTHTRHDDVVDEAWKWRDRANEEGGDGPPVAGVARGVAVYAVEVVHVGDGDVAAADDVVAVEGGG